MNKLYISLFIILNFSSAIRAQICDFKHIKSPQIEAYTEGGYPTQNPILSPRAVVTIPVVVHVVWKNPEENISEAQIKSQIEVLNQDFRMKNVDRRDVPPNFQRLAADCEIEFCLARVDTAGNMTTGITRTQTPFDNVGSTFSANKKRIYYNNIGGKGNWKPENYLNIWVCKMENGIGFTTALDSAIRNPQEDGIVVDYRHFGTIGTATMAGHKKGRTATHEIGHYFNLLHIWGSTETCTDDDLIDDTPQQAASTIGCPSFPKSDACNASIMYPNFMDYTNDECMGLFTQGQKTRMLAALTGFRKGLLRGGLCEPSATQDIDFQIVISPNPANDIVNITWKGITNIQKMDITLHNIYGQLVYRNYSFYTEGGKSISLSNYTSGLYMLSIHFDNIYYSKKIIISK
jgi:hypothetical protein